MWREGKEQNIQFFTRERNQPVVIGFLMDIIPETVAGAFVGGNILQVLFFSIPFGLALAMIMYEVIDVSLVTSITVMSVALMSSSASMTASLVSSRSNKSGSAFRRLAQGWRGAGP